MKRALNLFSIFVLVGILATGCTKFEEGSGISLKSKKGRLCRAWVPAKYVTADGTETTMSSSDGVVTYDKNGTVTMSAGSFSITSTWEFVGKDQIKSTYSFGSSSTSTTSTFVLLTSKELGTMDSDGNKTYYTAQ